MRLIDADALMNDAVIHWSATTNESCISVDAVDDAPTIDKLYGYNINDLIAFATACRRQGITEEDLYAFSQGMSNAYKCVYNEINNFVQDQLKNYNL